MRILAGFLVVALVFGAPACSSGSGSLQAGAELGGFSDVDAPESYNAATLYAYIDGGAEFFIKRGFVSLDVRRYSRGSEIYVVERYEMKDVKSASALYAETRRPEIERDLAGLRASVGPAEITLAKGRSYLVFRNDDPMATDNRTLVDLCLKVTGRLPAL